MNRRNIIKSIAFGVVSPGFFLKPGEKRGSLMNPDLYDKKTVREAIPSPNEMLFFKYPARYWNSQALHIGNGYLGLSFLGGVGEEIFGVTEKSLWTGGPGENKDYLYGIKKGGKEYLPKIRELILSNQIDNLKEADKLVENHFWGEEAGYGHFSAFGKLSLLFDHDSPGNTSAGYKNYSRSLNLSESIARVQYEAGGVEYQREYFCSYPDRIAVMKFSTGKNTPLSFRLKWNVFQKDHAISFSNDVLQLLGNINGNHRKFCLKMQFRYSQGKVYLQGDELVIENAGTVTILLAAATEYSPTPPLYRGADPFAITAALIDAVKNKTYGQLKDRHVKDYRQLYDRTSLTVPFHSPSSQGSSDSSDSSGSPDSPGFPKSGPEFLPTNERWESYKAQKNADPGLKVLYFNLGRYLLISSSRAGSLPANLQGGWNMVEAAPWSGNYQSNVNVQLNYSGACSTGLSECLDPYIDWIQGLVIPGREVAKEYYDSEGWVSHPIGNIWGYCAPGFGAEWGMYPSGAAWHCHFVWKKFAYSRDMGYLKQTGYPILKEAAAFWLQNLVEYKGWLITAPSGSAEHGAFLQDGKLKASGSSYGADVINIPGNFQDIEMIRELFSNTIEAAALLETDSGFADKIKTVRDRLMPLRAGQYGQLQEWAEDIDTPDCNHRHIAHLYAVWPAKQITPLAGPELVDAAKKALELRGEDRNYKNLPHKDIFTAANWSLGVRMACWIRLLNAERANKIFTQLITEAGFENLLTFQQTPMQFARNIADQSDMYYFTTPEGSWNPVWQVDASLAIPGFIAEMLLQTCKGNVFLLPALPEEWPDGRIKGLKTEGNLSVDIEWKNRKVTKYRIVSPVTQKINVHVNGETKEASTHLS